MTRRRHVVLVAAALSLVIACSRQAERNPTDQGITIQGAAQRSEIMQSAPPPALAIIGQLQSPESVLYDPQQDVYFISNINGGELAADGNGFISRVDAKTLATNLKWIEGGHNGVQLDGPKGMTLLGNVLYVSDVSAVRKFDSRTGAPLGAIPLSGATFINDLTNDGRSVFMSDTGLAMGPGVQFIPTHTDAIWRITNDRATKIASGDDLEHPNGLDFVDGKLLVASFGKSDLYDLGDDGKKSDATALPKGQLDGIVHLADGTLLISSWIANGVYRGKRGGPFKLILQGIDAPADIGYDTRRHRLLVPHSFANQVTIHDVR